MFMVDNLQFPITVPIHPIKHSLMLSLLRHIRHPINTEIIKAYQKELLKKAADKGSVPEYPRTFEQKIQLLNHPNTLMTLQVTQFGVKYKKGSLYFPASLILLALFGYVHFQLLPEKVIDTYLAVSNSTSLEDPVGWIGAAFTTGKFFAFYLPLLPTLYQATRFTKVRFWLAVAAYNALCCGIVAKGLVDERVKQYQIWDMERVTFGEGTWLCLAVSYWTQLGLKRGFTDLKSKVGLQAVTGLGIIKRGVPVATVCSVFIVLQCLMAATGEKNRPKNSELMAISVFNGVLAGLLLRKFIPLL